MHYQLGESCCLTLLVTLRLFLSCSSGHQKRVVGEGMPLVDDTNQQHGDVIMSHCGVSCSTQPTPESTHQTSSTVATYTTTTITTATNLHYKLHMTKKD